MPQYSPLEGLIIPLGVKYMSIEEIFQTMKELVAKYGDCQSNKAFRLSHYKDYLLNEYLREQLVEN